MHKQIQYHKKYIISQLEKPLDNKERRALWRYHNKRVRDFQHERLIHLLVTFFFAALLILSAAVFVLQPLPELKIPLGLLLLLLFILELAYIRHYYLLENGVQSLYDLTEKIAQHR